MELPYYALLIPYLIGLGIFLLWSVFNLYHLMKFGFFDFVGKIHTFAFVALSVIIIVMTMLYLNMVPWFDTFNPVDDLTNLLSPDELL